jgi:hypothetical protein
MLLTTYNDRTDNRAAAHATAAAIFANQNTDAWHTLHPVWRDVCRDLSISSRHLNRAAFKYQEHRDNAGADRNLFTDTARALTFFIMLEETRATGWGGLTERQQGGLYYCRCVAAELVRLHHDDARLMQVALGQAEPKTTDLNWCQLWFSTHTRECAVSMIAPKRQAGWALAYRGLMNQGMELSRTADTASEWCTRYSIAGHAYGRIGTGHDGKMITLINQLIK